MAFRESKLDSAPASADDCINTQNQRKLGGRASDSSRSFAHLTSKQRDGVLGLNVGCKTGRLPAYKNIARRVSLLRIAQEMTHTVYTCHVTVSGGGMHAVWQIRRRKAGTHVQRRLFATSIFLREPLKLIMPHQNRENPSCNFQPFL